MNRVLIVSASEKATERIVAWLGPAAEITRAESEAMARRVVGIRRFDLVVVNAPLPDGNCEALLAGLSPGALLLVPQARYNATRARMEPIGVMTLPKPVSAALFEQAVSLLRAGRARVERLEGKLEEVRIVERAKWALILYLKMSEAQAHRYIEKQAMDLRKTRREVAENIVKTYEN